MYKGNLDAEVIQGLIDLESDGSPGLVAELLGLLLTSAPDAFDAIAAGLARGDAAAVSGAAHSLKSSFANLGATELSGLANEIEAAARKGDLTRAPQQLAALRAGFPQVELALRELSDSLAR
jgi:HPt (histidine-containing phosphotransfer) domain-containing protein